MADGIVFPSKLEARRYLILREMERDGLIADLRVSANPEHKKQLTWKLEVEGSLICKYIADFSYTERGATVVEDSKGKVTPVYRLKAKLMKAIHGITIRETR